jgi:hypothetical protein
MVPHAAALLSVMSRCSPDQRATVGPKFSKNIISHNFIVPHNGGICNLLFVVPRQIQWNAASENWRPFSVSIRVMVFVVFAVKICYLQFRRFGWCFAALCLCAFASRS